MNFTIPTEQSRQIANMDAFVAKKLRNSMLWMVVGILTTMGSMFAILKNPAWLRMAFEHYTIIMFATLGMVFLFSARVYTASPTFLKIMFFSYAILNGFTLLVICLAYQATVVLNAFVGTLAFYVAMAIVGFVTKRDLTKLSSYLMAALIAMILTSLAMFFMDNVSGISLVLGYVGVIVFSLFTAVDINRIKKNIVMVAFEDESVLERVELAGALSLYLDFINLFISFLRIFGNRR